MTEFRQCFDRGKVALMTALGRASWGADRQSLATMAAIDHFSARENVERLRAHYKSVSAREDAPGSSLPESSGFIIDFRAMEDGMLRDDIGVVLRRAERLERALNQRVARAHNIPIEGFSLYGLGKSDGDLFGELRASERLETLLSRVFRGRRADATMKAFKAKHPDITSAMNYSFALVEGVWMSSLYFGASLRWSIIIAIPAAVTSVAWYANMLYTSAATKLGERAKRLFMKKVDIIFDDEESDSKRIIPETISLN